MKKVAVVILNYKARENTLKCADSVKKSDYENLEIIVVDNNSGDGLAEEIKKVVGVIFIQNKDNLGYSGGNNVGIKKALEDEAEYVFILNMDTVIDKKAITQLVIAIEENQAGVLGPKILFFDKKTIWYAGGTLDLNNVLGGHRGVDEEDHGQYEKIEETDNVTGGAMFVKSDIFVKIGLFDERYFLYMEDLDWCRRFWDKAWEVWYVASAEVIHYHQRLSAEGNLFTSLFSRTARMHLSSWIKYFLKFRKNQKK